MGLVTSAVVEIAAASMLTRDAPSLVSFATMFWSHADVHNVLHGIKAPADALDLAGLESDGQADHLARIIVLQCYGYPAGRRPIDSRDETAVELIRNTNVPIFEERARRRGRSDAERAARAPRRAARDLSTRLIFGGKPADRVAVIPDGRVVQVKIGSWIHSYRDRALEDIPALAYAAYSEHLEITPGARQGEQRRLNAALATLRRAQ